MFEIASRQVTIYSLLDMVEGTAELNAAAPRLTDWLAGGRDWLVLHDARVTARDTGRVVEIPLLQCNIARMECMIDEGEYVSDERLVAPRTRARINARFPSGLIVSGNISLPDGATWATSVDIIDDDDHLKALVGALIIDGGRVVRRDVTALVRLKAALFLHEDEDGGLIATIAGNGFSEVGSLEVGSPGGSPD